MIKELELLQILQIFLLILILKGLSCFEGLLCCEVQELEQKLSYLRESFKVQNEWYQKYSVAN